MEACEARMRSGRFFRSKYRNTWTEVDGRKFQSKAEARRYSQLRLLEKAGRIRDLKCQVTFPLVVNGCKLATYRADFSYYNENGELVVQDVKGWRGGGAYAMFRLKARLLEATLGIKVQEIS